MIGWNPATGKIHSWTFGCDGDLGEGVWSKKGNEWDVTFNQVLSDGHKMSATHIYTMLDGNTCTWQATGRQMDGKSLPDIGPVKLVRRRAVADAQRTRKGVGSRIDASGEFCYDNHMPRRIRASAGGIVYHVLNRGVGRMRLFRKAADFAAMETVLADALKRTPVCGQARELRSPNSGSRTGKAAPSTRNGLQRTRGKHESPPTAFARSEPARAIELEPFAPATHPLGVQSRSPVPGRKKSKPYNPNRSSVHGSPRMW